MKSLVLAIVVLVALFTPFVSPAASAGEVNVFVWDEREDKYPSSEIDSVYVDLYRLDAYGWLIWVASGTCGTVENGCLRNGLATFRDDSKPFLSGTYEAIVQGGQYMFARSKTFRYDGKDSFVLVVVDKQPLNLQVLNLQIEQVGGGSMLSFNWSVDNISDRLQHVTMIIYFWGPRRTAWSGNLPVKFADAYLYPGGSLGKKFQLDVTSLPDGWHDVEFALLIDELGPFAPAIDITYGVQKGVFTTGGGKG